MVCPPLTSSATNGGASSGSSSTGAKRWPSRWFTPSSGRSRLKASVLPYITPTSSAPTSPGPAVTAMPSSRSAADARVGERPLHHRADRLHVRPAGELRHDAAEDPVDVLGEDHQARERAASASSARPRRPRSRRSSSRCRGCSSVTEEPARRSSRSTSVAVHRRVPVVRADHPLDDRSPSRSSRKLSGTPVVW